MKVFFLVAPFWLASEKLKDINHNPCFAPCKQCRNVSDKLSFYVPTSRQSEIYNARRVRRWLESNCLMDSPKVTMETEWPQVASLWLNLNVESGQRIHSLASFVILNLDFVFRPWCGWKVSLCLSEANNIEAKDETWTWRSCCSCPQKKSFNLSTKEPFVVFHESDVTGCKNFSFDAKNDDNFLWKEQLVCSIICHCRWFSFVFFLSRDFSWVGKSRGRFSSLYLVSC